MTEWEVMKRIEGGENTTDLEYAEVVSNHLQRDRYAVRLVAVPDEGPVPYLCRRTRQ